MDDIKYNERCRKAILDTLKPPPPPPKIKPKDVFVVKKYVKPKGKS
jgi:hypothetical protein